MYLNQGGGGNSDFTVTSKSGLTGRGPYTSVVTVKTSSVTKNITCEKNVAISATKIFSKGGQQLHALGTIPTEKTVEGIDYYVSYKFSTNSRGIFIYAYDTINNKAWGDVYMKLAIKVGNQYLNSDNAYQSDIFWFDYGDFDNIRDSEFPYRNGYADYYTFIGDEGKFSEIEVEIIFEIPANIGQTERGIEIVTGALKSDSASSSSDIIITNENRITQVSSSYLFLNTTTDFAQWMELTDAVRETLNWQNPTIEQPIAGGTADECHTSSVGNVGYYRMDCYAYDGAISNFTGFNAVKFVTRSNQFQLNDNRLAPNLSTFFTGIAILVRYRDELMEHYYYLNTSYVLKEIDYGEWQSYTNYPKDAFHTLTVENNKIDLYWDNIEPGIIDRVMDTSLNPRGMTIGIIGRMAPLAGMVGYNENLVIYTNLEEKVGIHFNNNFIA